MTLGQRITEARRRLDWTQEELAAKAGVSRELLAKIECGTTQQPYYRNLVKIARALKVEPGTLQYGETPPALSAEVAAAATTLQTLPDEAKATIIRLIELLADKEQ
ncbi:MAG: helix-turn-helix transcriptional regulator [Methylomicrobium sp.]|nr:helix-turn-helix transcriptional regulator [Methylomicrobium sp.]